MPASCRHFYLEDIARENERLQKAAPMAPKPKISLFSKKVLASMNRFGYNTNSLRKKPRGCGGIGRRVRFRSVWGQPHEGSSPFARTIKLKSSQQWELFCNMRKPLSIGMFVRARFETGLFRFPSGEPAHAAWLSRRLPGKLISAGSCGCASGGQPGMSAHPTAFRFSVRRYRTNPVFCRARPRGCPSKRS